MNFLGTLGVTSVFSYPGCSCQRFKCYPDNAHYRSFWRFLSHQHTLDFVHLLFSTLFQLLNNDFIPPTAYHDMVHALFKQYITSLYAKLYTHEMHKMHSLFSYRTSECSNYRTLTLSTYSLTYQHHFPF